VNLLLRELPPGHRRLWAGGGAKNRMVRPSKLLMVLNDPSEAADSTSILPALREEFEVLSEKPYGGAVLHLLFEGIARNFLEETPETRRWLDRCFALEDELTAAGEISADFAVVVARKPGTRGENRRESRLPVSE
jgi:hypothetical protein